MLHERALPIRAEVRAACEFLGLDPLYSANEGKLVAICAAPDAPALLAAMRADPELAQIPVILVTALADRASQRQGRNIGADDYLTKPFQRDELLAALRGRLDRVSGMRRERERLSAEAQRLRLIDPVTSECKPDGAA